MDAGGIVSSSSTLGTAMSDDGSALCGRVMLARSAD